MNHNSLASRETNRRIRNQFQDPTQVLLNINKPYDVRFGALLPSTTAQYYVQPRVWNTCVSFFAFLCHNALGEFIHGSK